jgi:hypothetical protein
MSVADPGSSRRRSSSHLGRSIGDLLSVRKDGSHLFLRHAISSRVRGFPACHKRLHTKYQLLAEGLRSSH